MTAVEVSTFRWMIKLMNLLLAFLLAGMPNYAAAWIYPEHRDIAVMAVQQLDSQRRAVFDQLWQDARFGSDQQLCAGGAEAGQGVAPLCLDWAALSAIAGDHSCSSQDMLDTAIGSDWILVVADVAAQLKTDLARIPVTQEAGSQVEEESVVANARSRVADVTSRAQRVNALRTADIRLQRADPRYATRADANLAHFLMARPDTRLDPLAYGVLTLKPGSELNAMGVYVWYHISALQKASRLSEPHLSDEERRALARSALFDEAFALHFLEDSYAAGHVAGSWGDVSQRKGSHDFYNQQGLEVITWKGRDETIVLLGDAHMRQEDAARAAQAVLSSLEQVLDAASGKSLNDTLPPSPDAPPRADDFDICLSTTFPDRGLGLGSGGKGQYAGVLTPVLLGTVVPGLTPGLGARPRSRSEVGTFVGLAGTIDLRGVDGSFVPDKSDGGLIAGLDLGVRAGLGLEGALGETGDGLVFAQLGLRADTASTHDASGTVLGGLSGSLGAAIPARSAVSARFRMPYYLIPGDLMFLSPMYFFDRQRYEQLAVTAANGGLLGWQEGWATGFGRFQFVLGRELGINWYGTGLFGDAQLAAPSAQPGGFGRVVNYRSVYLDFPIIEFRPFRSFSDNQSSSVIFQLFGGVDLPYDESIDSPKGAPDVNLDSIYLLGVRMVFDWRYYY